MIAIEVTKGDPLKVRFNHGERFTVLTPGEHTITQEQANHWYIQAALQSGRVRLLPTATEAVATDAPATETVATDADDIEAKLLAVFPKLGEGDYKTDGTPLVKAVEALLGEGAKADQIAAAWAKYQAGE